MRILVICDDYWHPEMVKAGLEPLKIMEWSSFIQRI